MNLEETIKMRELEAGGPGSGRHPGATKPSAEEWKKMTFAERSAWMKQRAAFLKDSGGSTSTAKTAPQKTTEEMGFKQYSDMPKSSVKIYQDNFHYRDSGDIAGAAKTKES